MDEKCMTLLDMIHDYNESKGSYQKFEDILNYSASIGAELDVSGWYIEGFGHDTGYYPAR